MRITSKKLSQLIVNAGFAFILTLSMATASVSYVFSDTSTAIAVDSEAPVVAITSPEGNLFNTDTTLKITVTDENPRHYWLEIKKDGAVMHVPGVTGVRHETTSFTDKPATTLTAEGSYVITLAARDAVGGGSDTGNRSGGVVKKFVIDKTAPSNLSTGFIERGSGDSVANGGFTNEELLTFNLSADGEPNRWQLKYWNDNVGVGSVPEANPWNLTDLASSGYMDTFGVYMDKFTKGEGTHYFAFSACDAAGNCSSYSTPPFAVTYDRTAPSAPTANLTENNGKAESIALSTGDSTDTIYYTLEGSDPSDTNSSSRTKYTGDVALDTSRAQTVRAIAYDRADNVSPEFTATYNQASRDETRTDGTPGSSATSPSASDSSAQESPTDDVEVTARSDADEQPTGETLGTSTSALESDEKGGEVLAAIDDQGGCGKFLGLCWYWWVPITVAATGVVWVYLAARSRRSGKDDLPFQDMPPRRRQP